MKKKYLILTLFTLFLTISCTNSDGHDSSKELSVKIDGTTKYFKDITVVEDVYPDYTDYILSAKQKDDETKLLTIMMEKGATGTESIYYIQYFDSNEYYEATLANLTTNITENSESKLIGTFSASLEDENASSTIQFTQGSFNINF